MGRSARPTKRDLVLEFLDSEAAKEEMAVATALAQCFGMEVLPPGDNPSRRDLLGAARDLRATHRSVATEVLVKAIGDCADEIRAMPYPSPWRAVWLISRRIPVQPHRTEEEERNLQEWRTMMGNRGV